MKPKVVWTTREWRKVAEWFARNDVNPDDRGFIANLDTAQMAMLSADRRRTMVGLPKEVRQRVKEEVAAFKAGQQTVQKLTKIFPEPKPPTAQELSTEELLVELARRAAKFICRFENFLYKSDGVLAVAEPVDRAFHPAPKHDPNPVQEVKAPRKKVLVIGPNNDAEKFLHEEFPNLALRFVNKDDPPSRITDLAPCCEVIVAVTKFCSHKQTETMKAQNKTPWVLVTSTQELREWLRKWL